MAASKVQRALEIVENVCKMSSMVKVNKSQCERIADHFRVVAKVLQDSRKDWVMRLGEDFVDGRGESEATDELPLDESSEDRFLWLDNELIIRRWRDKYPRLQLDMNIFFLAHEYRGERAHKYYRQLYVDRGLMDEDRRRWLHGCRVQMDAICLFMDENIAIMDEGRVFQMHGHHDLIYDVHHHMCAVRDLLRDVRVEVNEDGLLCSDEHFSQIRQLRAEMDELYAKKDELYSKKDELYAMKDELCSRKDGLYAKKDELYSKKDELYAMKDELCSRKDGLYANNEIYTKRHISHDKKRLLYAMELHAIMDRFYAYENQIYAAKDKLDGNIYKLHAEIDELYAEIDELYAKEDELHAKEDKLYAKKDELYAKEKLYAKMDGYDRLTGAVVVKMDELDVKRDEIDAKMNEIDAWRNEFHAKMNAIVAKKNEFVVKTGAVRAMMDEVLEDGIFWIDQVCARFNEVGGLMDEFSFRMDVYWMLISSSLERAHLNSTREHELQMLTDEYLADIDEMPTHVDDIHTLTEQDRILIDDSIWLGLNENYEFGTNFRRPELVFHSLEGIPSSIESVGLGGSRSLAALNIVDLLKVFHDGQDLVLFHKGLEEVTNAVVDRTGLYGEKFKQIHVRLHRQLYCFIEDPIQYLDLYLDPLEAVRSLVYYVNSNCLGASTNLSIDFDNIANVELATALGEMLKRPDCVLKTLKLRSKPLISRQYIDEQAIRKCRSTVVAALGRSTALTHFRIERPTREDVRELCNSLSSNTVLKELVMLFFTSLGDDNADTLSAMLKRNRSLKTFRLWSRGISPEGAASLGAMLTGNSTLEELDVSGNLLGGVGMKHLLRPLMANNDSEPPVNTSLKLLHIGGNNIGGRMGGVSVVAQTLRTNKTLIHFSMQSEDLEPDEACEILKSLKNNKTLQVLDISYCSNFYFSAGAVFMDLLVKYNFTLRTIHFHSRAYSIEDFMEALSERHGVADLEQGIDQETCERPTTEVCGSSSTSMIQQEQMEPVAEDLRCLLDPTPKYNTFLSHSEEEREFAMQLYMDLKSSKYSSFSDQDSEKDKVEDELSTSIFEAAKQCQLVIIVLSKGYLTSKRSMVELSAFLKWKASNNPTLKVFPLYYKLTPSDLDAKKVEAEWAKSWEVLVQDGKVEKEEIVSWREAVMFLHNAKNGASERIETLLKNLIHCEVEAEEFCKSFSDVVVRDLWPVCDGLDFKNYGNSQVKYISAVVEKIDNYMLPVKECKTDQISGYQHMLEMRSELSLLKMKSFLEKESWLKKESKYKKEYLLRRGLNKAESLQYKYIQCNTFEEMCSDIQEHQKSEFGKGRITAALFPKTFVYYFKTLMLRLSNYFDYDKDYLRMLQDAANLVAKRLQSLQGHEHQSFYVDIDTGLMLSLDGIVAICQNFPGGEEIGRDLQTNIAEQYGIVQDGLTGAYYYGRIEALDLGEQIIAEAVGVIGVKVIGTDIHVEDMREDGSYYSGILEDFSYDLGLDKNKDVPVHKQCAAKVFGDLEGASFLRTERGMKCSPLIIIALASAIQREGLKLSWNEKYGHMEIDQNLASLLPSKLEINECQILYTDKIKQLGVAVEWGMDGMAVDSNGGASSSNFQRVQTAAAKFSAGAQDKTKVAIDVKVLGSGGGGTVEVPNRIGMKLMKQANEELNEVHWRGKRGFKEVEEYIHLKDELCQGTLHAAEPTYLVVYDNVRKSHVSIYVVKEGAMKDELKWITDIFLDGGAEQRIDIFKRGLKGRDLTVQRSGTDYTIVPQHRPGLFAIFEKCIRSKHLTNSMIELGQLGLSEQESKNEWEHIIGRQQKFSDCRKYFWKASFMQAIIFSRTKISSGKLLTTGTHEFNNLVGRIGNCSRDDSKDACEYVHRCIDIETRGRFSKSPASQPPSLLIKWGGLQGYDGYYSCTE